MAEEGKEIEDTEAAEAEDNNMVENSSSYAITKNFFNFEGIGPIDGNVVVVDEIESFVCTTRAIIANGKKAPLNDIFNQIFNFFAVMAYDANLTAGDMKAADHGLAMTTSYSDIVSNLSMKEDWHGIFFSKWPGDALPQEYLTWADEVFRHGKNGKDADLNKWIDKEASKYSGAAKEIKLKVYFGHLLIVDAVKAIGKIKQFHNRYWVHPSELHSGKSLTALYVAMKRQLLKIYAQEQGYNTLYKRAEWKNKTWSLEEKAAKLEAYREKKIKEWEEKGDTVYLPDYWLTFLLCSFPMNVHFPTKKMTLDCLVPPEEPVAESMVVAPPKAQRRGERANAGKTKGTASASTLPVMDLTNGEYGSNTFTFVHKRDHVSSPYDNALKPLLAELEQLKTNIVILTNVPGTHAAVDKLNARLVKVILEVTRLQELQSDHFAVKRPRNTTPASASTVRTPATAGSKLPTSSAVPTNALGIMDPNATSDYYDENFYSIDNDDNDDDAEDLHLSLQD